MLRWLPIRWGLLIFCVSWYNNVSVFFRYTPTFPILVAAVVISYLFSIIAFVIKLGKNFWAKSLQPFVPQWTGDVVVLQNTVAQSALSGERYVYKR